MSQKRPTVSFEFFPTKTDAGHEKLLNTARELAGYNPDFFSCTYGAGGSTRDNTFDIVSAIKDMGIDVAPHLSFGGDDEGAKGVVQELVSALDFDVVDAGPLAAARYLEPTAMLWIHLATQL